MPHGDDGVCAVTRSTDLRQHARLLHKAHDARLQGTRPTTEKIAALIGYDPLDVSPLVAELS